MKMLKAIVGVVVAAIAFAYAPNAHAEYAGVTINNVWQNTTSGTVHFNVDSDANSFYTNNVLCNGSVDFDGSYSGLITADIETSDAAGYDFMATPLFYDEPPPSVGEIEVSCDWQRSYRATYRKTFSGWKWRGGAGMWKKVGAGRTYSYLPGTLTIDNRASSSPTTVYWRTRHPGWGSGARYYWNQYYSTPGNHPSKWLPIGRGITEVRITIDPYMMFTVNQIGVYWRHTRRVSEVVDVEMTGDGHWTG
jgi:hypothetical protein